MKNRLSLLCSFLLVVISFTAFSQENKFEKKGFRENEARDLMALCCSYTFLDLYGDDQEIIPKAFEKRYTSSDIGMDNKFQIYVYQKIGIINLRGSTADRDSWLENLYSTMIPAQGTIEIDSTKFNYDFAREDSASVHSGYALAIAFLSDSILHQIRALGKEGINDFVITGHSQGGALAQLLTAYLIHHPDADIRRNHYKTYAFASPKVGNKIFAKEYQKKRRSLSFDVINPADIVPKFPFNYNDTDIVTMEDWKAIFDEDKEFGLGTKMKDGAKRMVELPLRSSFRMVGRGASRELNDGEVLIVMPEESKDLNYFVLDSLIEIPSFDYPKILLDSAILENPRSKKWKKDSLGHFVNDEFYRQEPKSWQHKPYNYYVGLLKLYFPDEYEKLSKKYLPENI